MSDVTQPTDASGSEDEVLLEREADVKPPEQAVAPVQPKCPECKSTNIRVDSFDHTNVFCVWCTGCGHVYGVGYGPVEGGCPPIPVAVTTTEQPVKIEQPIQVRVM